MRTHRIVAFVICAVLLLAPAVSAQTPVYAPVLVSAKLVGGFIELRVNIVDTALDSDPDTAGIQPTIIIRRSFSFMRQPGETVQDWKTRARARTKKLLKRAVDKLSATPVDVKSEFTDVETLN